MSTLTATRISLELGCSDACNEFAGPLYLQMSSGKYDECAVLPLARDLSSLSDWRDAHRTARKRADRAARRGYRFAGFDRGRRARDIHEINTSAESRQGRPMSEGYRTFPTRESLPLYACQRHAVRAWGIEDRDSRLAAYAYVYRAGELALVSQILGHADHLENEIMYLLIEGIVGAESFFPDGYLVYNRYDSGTDGLRFFKDRCGFAPTQVEWAP